MHIMHLYIKNLSKSAIFDYKIEDFTYKSRKYNFNKCSHLYF